MELKDFYSKELVEGDKKIDHNKLFDRFDYFNRLSIEAHYRLVPEKDKLAEEKISRLFGDK